MTKNIYFSEIEDEILHFHYHECGPDYCVRRINALYNAEKIEDEKPRRTREAVMSRAHKLGLRTSKENKRGGRPSSLSQDQKDQIEMLAGKMSASAIAEHLGIPTPRVSYFLSTLKNIDYGDNVTTRSGYSSVRTVLPDDVSSFVNQEANRRCMTKSKVIKEILWEQMVRYNGDVQES